MWGIKKTTSHYEVIPPPHTSVSTAIVIGKLRGGQYRHIVEKKYLASKRHFNWIKLEERKNQPNKILVSVSFISATRWTIWLDLAIAPPTDTSVPTTGLLWTIGMILSSWQFLLETKKLSVYGSMFYTVVDMNNNKKSTSSVLQSGVKLTFLHLTGVSFPSYFYLSFTAYFIRIINIWTDYYHTLQHHCQRSGRSLWLRTTRFCSIWLVIGW